jgi:molybdopterin-biosynthesis enzyme MoeA-like protein
MTVFGLIIIGDEILSGKRQDKHFAKVLELMSERGLTLSWVKYLGDDRQRCVDTLRSTFSTNDVVFSCGGIGATPDDHTRQSAGLALHLPLELHPEAAKLITQRTQEMAADGRGSPDMTRPENLQRLKMGEFPQGASIIPNPYNKIPGFNVARHWFVPGFPVMAWPMIAWVLDTHYKNEFHRQTIIERSMLVFHVAEADATPLMEAIERQFDGVKVYSLPSMGEGGQRRHIELGVKTDRNNADLLENAFLRLQEGVRDLGGTVST